MSSVPSSSPLAPSGGAPGIAPGAGTGGIPVTTQGPVTLPQLVLRNLGDRSYEKRKQAALEIEHQIKELNAPSVRNADGIKSIIAVLVKDFAYSTQSNHRKGGLIGLAATAIALMEDTAAYLEHLLPPVLKCFADQESRVRYYACEALYNITKVARGSVLLFFNEIFDGLCKLYADVDVDVKNGAQLLDRLIKDVVTESDHFDVDKFIPLLRERIRIKNPFIRQLLVGWITVLDSVPDIDMVSFLPEYLGGLFDMLSDPNKDIRQQAYAALAELLREIMQNNPNDLGPMVLILVSSSDSRDNFTRLTVLSWMYEFVQLGKHKLLPYVAEMLGTALTCCADSEKEIRQKAEKLHESLLKLVQTSDQKLDIHPILNKVTLQLLNKWVPTRLAALRWISMLLTKMPGTLFHYLNELFPALLKTLQDPDDQVVRLDLEVLARISLNTNYALDNHNFQMVLNHVIQLFSSDRRFLETRGSLIIRQLCELLDAESIYRALSIILVAHEDLEFASIMVQTLNLILLTSPELFNLRMKIKEAHQPSSSTTPPTPITTPAISGTSSIISPPIFESLYAAWVHNPVSTLSLCLLAQSYDLASSLVFCISDLEVTVGSLMQLDKLVQLIESPIFIHLRLQLLEPQTHTALIKALYGILMLLPQSSAFVSLKTRLESVSPLAALAAAYTPSASTPAKPSTTSTLSKAQFTSLLQAFQQTQAKHQQRRQKVYRDTSLLNRPPVDDLSVSSLSLSTSTSPANSISSDTHHDK